MERAGFVGDVDAARFALGLRVRGLAEVQIARRRSPSATDAAALITVEYALCDALRRAAVPHAFAGPGRYPGFGPTEGEATGRRNEGPFADPIEEPRHAAVLRRDAGEVGPFEGRRRVATADRRVGTRSAQRRSDLRGVASGIAGASENERERMRRQPGLLRSRETIRKAGQGVR